MRVVGLLDNAKAHGLNASVSFQQGKFKEAQHTIIEMVSSVQQALVLMSSSGDLQKILVIKNEKGVAVERCLSEFLCKVNAQISSSKHVELADSLEYELPEILKPMYEYFAGKK